MWSRNKGKGKEIEKALKLSEDLGGASPWPEPLARALWSRAKSWSIRLRRQKVKAQFLDFQNSKGKKKRRKKLLTRKRKGC